MYASCISSDYINEQYEKYVQSIRLEVLKLNPKKGMKALRMCILKFQDHFHTITIMRSLLYQLQP